MKIDILGSELLNSIPLPAFLLNQFGRIERGNAALSCYTGIPLDQLRGRMLVTLIPDKAYNAYENAIGELKSGKINSFQLPVLQENEAFRLTKIDVSSLHHKKDPLFFCVCSDQQPLQKVQEEKRKLMSELRKTKKTLQSLTENIGDIIWTMTLQLKTTYVSPSVTKVTGYTQQEYMDKSLEELLTAQSALQARQVFLDEFKKLSSQTITDRNYSFTGEFQAVKKNGELFWADIKVTPVYDELDKLVAIQGITRDVTERVRALSLENKYNNDLLYLSNSSLELLDYDEETIFHYITTSLHQLIDNSLVILYKIDPLRRKIHVTQMLGFDLLPAQEQSILHNNFAERSFTLTDDLIRIFKENSLYNYADKLRTFPLQNNLDITLRFLQAKLDLHKIYSIGISYGHEILGGLSIFTYNEQDITNPNLVQILVSHVSTALHRKRLESELIREKNNVEKALGEKEVLLQEVHHRVKNNMAVISGLLKLQGLQVEDKQLKNVLKDSQDRIRSMSLVHEKLYQGGDIARINLGDYVKTLVTGLISNYKRGYVQFRMENDQFFLDLDTAIPLGLMINEIVTNALKYAFPQGQGYEDGEKEAILFFRTQEDANQWIIEIGDNGVGMEKNDPVPDTMGLSLIENMAHQMDAKISMVQGQGLVYHIAMPGDAQDVSRLQ